MAKFAKTACDPVREHYDCYDRPGDSAEISGATTLHVPIKPAAETLTVFAKVGWVGFRQFQSQKGPRYSIDNYDSERLLLLYHLPKWARSDCPIRSRWFLSNYQTLVR
jgi:hypothetical protein